MHLNKNIINLLELKYDRKIFSPCAKKNQEHCFQLLFG